ncbi:MAG: PQQ-binding-like beta-propeller repeat protein [Pirellulales bacterium]
MKRLAICMILLAMGSTIAAAERSNPAPASYPQFRGPDGQGHAAAGNLPQRWSESENVRWKTPVPGLGWSSPAIASDRIWLTTAVEAAGSLRVVCVARDTGQVLFDKEVFHADDLGRIAAKNSHASPTPVVDGANVFVHFGAHGTACLTADGEVVWTHKLAYDHRHGPGGSPIVWNDLVIVSCDGTDVQYTAALDKRTGEVRWQADHPGLQAYSTPLIIRVKDRPQLITSGGEALIAYSPADGKELWRCRHGGHSIVPRPVEGNGLVYFCTGYWTPALVAVRPDGTGDVTDSHVAFRVRHSVPHTPSPLLVGNRLYLVSDQGVLSCADAMAGKELWRERLGGNFSASPTLADGKIYCLDEDGTMHVLAAGEKFEKLAENHVDGRTLATPAFVESAIYLRSDTHLYCIEAAGAPRGDLAGSQAPDKAAATGDAPRNVRTGATAPKGSRGKFLR